MSEPAPPNGRNHLKVARGNTSVGLATNNLVTILLIVLIALVAYANWTTRKEGVAQVRTAIETLRRDVRDLLIRHEYNQDIPREQRVPLDLPSEAVPKPERRN
jgi:hypothetical protein